MTKITRFWLAGAEFCPKNRDMESTALPKPFALYVLLSLLLFLGVGGVYGGFHLTDDPTGRSLGMPDGSLAHSPFPDYLIPGLILLVFNGIFPFLVAYALVYQPDWRWAEALNIYRNRHWAWTFSLYCGLSLCIWINVQMLMVADRAPLQPIYGLYGLLLVIFTMMPKVMRYFEKPGAA